MPAISSENFFNHQNGSRVMETFQIREAVDKTKGGGTGVEDFFSKHTNSFIGKLEKCKVRQKSGPNIFNFGDGKINSAGK